MVCPGNMCMATLHKGDDDDDDDNDDDNNNETKLKISTLIYGKEVILLSSALEYKNFKISRPMYQLTPRRVNWYTYQTVRCRITVDHHIRLDSSTRLWTTNIYTRWFKYDWD